MLDIFLVVKRFGLVCIRNYVELRFDAERDEKSCKVLICGFFRKLCRVWRKVSSERLRSTRETDLCWVGSTAIVPLARGARKGRKGNWRRNLLVRAAGHGGRPHAQVERYYPRSRQRTCSPLVRSTQSRPSPLILVVSSSERAREPHLLPPHRLRRHLPRLTSLHLFPHRYQPSLRQSNDGKSA